MIFVVTMALKQKKSNCVFYLKQINVVMYTFFFYIFLHFQLMAGIGKPDRKIRIINQTYVTKLDFFVIIHRLVTLLYSSYISLFFLLVTSNTNKRLRRNLSIKFGRVYLKKKVLCIRILLSTLSFFSLEQLEIDR